MNVGETLYVTQRQAWRSWLAKNHDSKKEIWLVYYRKSSGQPGISYNDAVEEALCYGWIDSKQQHIDEERFAQRFSPRKPASTLSQMNKEHIRQLMVKKKMKRVDHERTSAIFRFPLIRHFVILSTDSCS